MPARVAIRDMRPSDLDGVLDIERVSFPTPWTPQMFREEMERAFSDVLAAVPEGEEGPVLGYAVCWTIAGESHLLNIATHPERRGEGVARALVRECIRRGARGGSLRIHLEVRAGNDPAIALYRSERFVFNGVRKGYYTDTGEDALLFTREIRGNDAG